MIFGLLPISPKYCLISYDIRKLEIISGEAKDKDVKFINSCQATQSLLAIYSHEPILEESKTYYKELFDKYRKMFRGFTSLESSSFEYVKYKNNLSFIKLRD